MKRMIVIGCLVGALVATACERLAPWRDNGPQEEAEEPLTFTLDEVARLVAAVPLGQAQVAEVHDAVSSSSGNGYDEEYPMRQVFEAPGSGVGDAATRANAYPEPLRDLLAAEIRKRYATRAGEADAFLDALTASDVQIYWPYSDQFEGDESPVITYDPGGRETKNVGWIRRDDGTVEEVVVDEEMALERPVWVINRNRDAEYQSLEMRRREDPE